MRATTDLPHIDFVLGDPADGSVEDFVHRARAFNPRRDPRLLRYSLLHNLRQRPDGDWTWKYDRRGLTPESFARVRKALEGLRDDTDTITCPVLVIRGAESDALCDEQAARFASSLPAGRWAKVENAGHTVHGDNPRGLARVLVDFLAEIGH
jgi:pimeloyl-ACP methyl ester carboxylesterase